MVELKTFTQTAQNFVTPLYTNVRSFHFHFYLLYHRNTSLFFCSMVGLSTLSSPSNANLDSLPYKSATEHALTCIFSESFHFTTLFTYCTRAQRREHGWMDRLNRKRTNEFPSKLSFYARATNFHQHPSEVSRDCAHSHTHIQLSASTFQPVVVFHCGSQKHCSVATQLAS